MKKKKIIIFCQTCNKKMKLLPCQSHKKTCGNKLCYSKYISNKMIKVRNKKHIKKKCKNCRKILNLVPSTKKKKFCSVICKHKWLQKNKKGIWNPKVNKKATHLGGVQANIVNKKNGTGIYGIPKYKRQEYGKRASPQSKITNKKNKTGLFDYKIRNKGREIAFQKIRKRKNYKYQNMYFDSKYEIEIAMCIYHQLNIKLKRNKNYQVKVGKEYIFDFLIGKCFIEQHIINIFFNPLETKYNYYRKRRLILNKNGYKNYNLVVIF